MHKLLAALVAICLAGHVWLGFTLGLSTDEAHYALYALHPALSYFDHPPLVGWIQILPMWMGGADWMMRVVPLLLWSLTAWMLWRFSIWALVLFLLSPTHQLLGLALIPDTLLLPLTLWIIVLTQRLSVNITYKPYWIWLGVALGLAGLSKYTGVFLALGAAIVLFASHGVSLLKSRGLWLAALIAAVLISPVLIWNAQHEWVSFAYQFSHADGGTNSWNAKRLLTYSLIQLLAYGSLPLLGLLVFSLKLRKQHTALMRLCLAFGAPSLAVALYFSGKGAALPHWTAAAWLALLPVSTSGLQYLWQRIGGRYLLVGLGSVQCLCVVAISLAMCLGGQWRGQSLLRGVTNPFADLHDWKEVSAQAVRLQAKYQTNSLAVGNWSLASRLAWYTERANPKSRVIALDGKNKQFDIWYGDAKKLGTFIWLDWSEMPQNIPTGCQKLNKEDSTYLGKYSSFDFYFCSNKQVSND